MTYPTTTYLRVECYACRTDWNYYEEKQHYPPLLTTQVEYQGCVCPRCGYIGFTRPTAGSKVLAPEGDDRKQGSK